MIFFCSVVCLLHLSGTSHGGKFLDNLTDARAVAREYEASTRWALYGSHWEGARQVIYLVLVVAAIQRAKGLRRANTRERIKYQQVPVVICRVFLPFRSTVYPICHPVPHMVTSRWFSGWNQPTTVSQTWDWRCRRTTTATEPLWRGSPSSTERWRKKEEGVGVVSRCFPWT